MLYDSPLPRLLNLCACQGGEVYLLAFLQPGVTTDAIDRAVHQMIIDNGAYPSPLNYGEHTAWPQKRVEAGQRGSNGAA